MPAYKDDKRKSWYSQFYYTEADGTRKKKYKRGFSTRRDALAWERDFIAASDRERERLAAIGAAPKTFADAIELHFALQGKSLKPRTIESRLYVYNTFLGSWRSLPVEKISERHIIALQDDLLARGLSPSTVRKYEDIAKTLYKAAAAFCNITRDPFRNLPAAGKPSRKRVSFWTLDQYKAFSAGLDQQLKTPFDLLFYTGCRLGEMQALRVCDIDLAACTISISRTYEKRKGTEEAHEPKTPNSVRTISIQKALRDELQDYINRLYGIGSSDRLFPFARQTYRDAIRKYCDQHPEAPRISVHDLRHSHAAMLIDRGIETLAISERLGHSSVSVTLNLYGHLYPDKQAALVAALPDDI